MPAKGHARDNEASTLSLTARSFWKLLLLLAITFAFASCVFAGKSPSISSLSPTPVRSEHL